MKKIGIVTLYGNYNLGNKLQNYAVVKLYQNCGFQVKTIYYDLDEYRASGNSVNKYKVLAKDVLCRLGVRAKSIEKYRIKKEREKLFEQFSKKYLELGERISFENTSSLDEQNYDFFSVGSDQVWRNFTGLEEEFKYFMLTFTDKKKRICLSPSFGVSKIETDKEEKYAKALSEFKYLSSREVSGVELIRHLTGKNADLLPDPTLAISKKEWNFLAKKPIFKVPEKYILVYFLGSCNEEEIRQIERIADEFDLKILNIYDINNNPQYYISGPSEFIYLINQASLVCTNSFHGSIFSIIFNKNFIVYKRHEGKNSTYSRIETLVNYFKLGNRQASLLQREDLFKTDFEYANNKLINIREKFEKYIKKVTEIKL